MGEYPEDEYEHIMTETAKVKDCITEYIKMYYGVGVLVIGVFWYVTQKSGEGSSFSFSSNSTGAAFIMLGYIIISFTTILFHKFNTHNRYAGYATALELYMAEDTGSLKPPGRRRMWELAQLHEAREFDSLRDLEEIRRRTDRISAFYSNLAFSLDPEVGVVPIARRIGRGFVMIVRATLIRHPTRSWTYPYQVAFPMFLSYLFIVILELFWIVTADNTSPLVEVLVVMALLHMAASWCGLAFRLHRLCADDGDRTIAFYAFRYRIVLHSLIAATGGDAQKTSA